MINDNLDVYYFTESTAFKKFVFIVIFVLIFLKPTWDIFLPYNKKS